MKQRQATNGMVHLNQNILIIALNINELNAPVKRQKLSEWFLKTIHLLFIILVKRILVEFILQ